MNPHHVHFGNMSRDPLINGRLLTTRVSEDQCLARTCISGCRPLFAQWRATCATVLDTTAISLCISVIFPTTPIRTCLFYLGLRDGIAAILLVLSTKALPLAFSTASTSSGSTCTRSLCLTKQFLVLQTIFYRLSSGIGFDSSAEDDELHRMNP